MADPATGPVASGCVRGAAVASGGVIGAVRGGDVGAAGMGVARGDSVPVGAATGPDGAAPGAVVGAGLTTGAAAAGAAVDRAGVEDAAVVGAAVAGAGVVAAGAGAGAI